MGNVERCAFEVECRWRMAIIHARAFPGIGSGIGISMAMIMAQ